MEIKGYQERRSAVDASAGLVQVLNEAIDSIVTFIAISICLALVFDAYKSISKKW